MYYYVHKMIVCILHTSTTTDETKRECGERTGHHTPPKTTAPPSITVSHHTSSHAQGMSPYTSQLNISGQLNTMNNDSRANSLARRLALIRLFSSTIKIFS